VLRPRRSAVFGFSITEAGACVETAASLLATDFESFSVSDLTVGGGSAGAPTSFVSPAAIAGKATSTAGALADGSRDRLLTDSGPVTALGSSTLATDAGSLAAATFARGRLTSTS